VGVCIGCVKSACPSQLTDCNADCACNNLIVGVFECFIAKGQDPSCLAGLAGAATGDTAEKNLVQCVFACQHECLGGGGDGGKDGGSDAPDAD
jgi:hypothetical protein